MRLDVIISGWPGQEVIGLDPPPSLLPLPPSSLSNDYTTTPTPHSTRHTWNDHADNGPRRLSDAKLKADDIFSCSTQKAREHLKQDFAHVQINGTISVAPGHVWVLARPTFTMPKSRGAQTGGPP